MRVNNDVPKSLKKLLFGYRPNSAGGYTAGLVISEKDASPDTWAYAGL